MSITLQNSRVVILVKAMPNPSRKYGETVCCAGVTPDGKWKRLFPVRFRQLKSKFTRWDWIEFGYRRPTNDARPENCHLYEDTLKVDGRLKAMEERARLLVPLISKSTVDAAARGLSLTLIRPLNPRFRFRPKRKDQIEAERDGYKRAARQGSFLDDELDTLEPGRHVSSCGDWETSATFRNFTRSKGEKAALDYLTSTFTEEYPSKGMVFAMGTVKARPRQWLLLGVIRLDELTEEQSQQTSLPF
jgi:hypothetical protein